MCQSEKIPSYYIYPAKEEDLSHIYGLEVLLFSRPWREADIRPRLVREDCVSFVAKEEGRLIGYLLAETIPSLPPQADILSVGVNPLCQNRGIGQALLAAAEEKLRAMGVGDILLEVRQSNAPARRLYEKCGFAVIGCRKGYYDAPVEDGLIMQKILRKGDE